MKCAACNAEISTGSKYCSHCGHSVFNGVDANDKNSSSYQPRSEPERRQLTVMFCDLVESTSLADRHDPEDLRELILAYQNQATDVVKRYEGFVARYVGDGLLVYFGYPEARGNDAERAVYAALDVVRAVSALEVTLGDEKINDLAVRVGIATGLVVVGDFVGDKKSLHQSEAFGRTPNLAARIQSLASPNQVLIESHTYHILGNAFEYECLGRKELKGIADSTLVWKVIQAIDIDSRLDDPGLAMQTPMVNREDELDIFLQYWKRAKLGKSRFVLLSGEAGIGKSRVVRELQERIKSEPHRFLRFQCSSYHVSSAFYPVIHHIERTAGFESEDSDDQKLAKLKILLSPLVESVTQAVPLIAALLSVAVKDQFPPLDMSPERLKESTLELLVDLLVPTTNTKPTLIVVEDAHWIDPSSEELFYRVMSREKSKNMLLIVTSRISFPSRWTTRPGVLLLTMDRLSHDNSIEIVENLIGDDTLPSTVIDLIVAKSDGVPLFVEELTKTVLTADEAALSNRQTSKTTDEELAIPESLQDSLMARLDQLNIGKRLIQIGAVIGREFPYDLLAAVSELPDDELNRALRQLHDTGVIHAVGAPPHSRYIFKHALVRDAAYESLLKRKRRELHAAIASALEKQYPHRAAIEPEILGHHYTEAGLAEQAIANWQKAARQAMRRLTFVEAINHVEKGLNCLAGLTDPTLKMRSELALRTLLGPALMATHGYGAREVEQAYARARELCEQVPETPELFPVLFGLWGFHLVRAEYQDARDLTEQLLSLAKAAKDDGLLVEAHGSTGVTLFYLGELTSSRSHLEQCMTVYDPSKHREHALLYGQDPWVAASSFRGQVMWLLGFPDSALDSTTQAVKRAKEMRHHFSITFSQFLHCCVLHLRREPEALRKEAEAGLVLSEQQGFPYWVPRFRFFRGWALTEQGKIEEGVAEMLLCLDREQASSLFVRRPYYLALLAEAKSKLNEVGMGLEIIEEAIDEFEQFPDRWSEPEIYRIKGELLLKSTASGNDAHVQNEAQQNFEKALALARQQDAKAWELRALLSLYRLHSKQGTAENSRDLLKSVVNTFEEGMKTRDILEVEKAVSE